MDVTTTAARSLFAMTIFMVSAHALACGGNKADCGPITSWFEVDRLEMTLEDDQGRGSAHWVISIDANNNDVVIDKDERFDGKTIQGTLIIVSGRMMLSKGLDLKEGYEIDAADGPSLMMQLLLKLLGHVAPDGPEAIKGRVAVDHSENNQPIRVTTMSASGTFGTPWRAKGFLEKASDNAVTYEIQFHSALNPENQYGAKMRGHWMKRNQPLLEDDMSLEGWKFYTIGPYTKQFESGTMLDYGAQQTKVTSATIGALRQLIQQKDNAPNPQSKPSP